MITIQLAMQLLMALIKIARDAKELSNKDLEEMKKQLDEEFLHFPTHDEL